MRLNEPQRRFAEKHHNLIYKFLWKNHLDISDDYDLIAIGYVIGVYDYLTKPYLRKYCFSTIAWRAMDFELNNYKRYLKRYKRKGDILSLDAIAKGSEATFWEFVAMEDNEESYDTAIFWIDTEITLTNTQFNVMQQKLKGVTHKELALKLGKSQSSVARMVKKIKISLAEERLLERSFHNGR